MVLFICLRFICVLYVLISCFFALQAYNGIGSPATLEIVLLLDVAPSTNEQNILPYDPSINQIPQPSRPQTPLG